MIKISEENNPELYSMPIDRCLDFLKKIEDCEIKTDEKIIFHTYWHIGREFERKQILPLKSFLATQNLKTCELYVWSNVDLSNNEHIKDILPYITLKIYDPLKESIGTPVENNTRILDSKDDICWLNGDLFRVLVLHNYGGVYYDMDVALLRDFSPILDQEFMYMWGFSPKAAGINGAVMRLFKKSKLSYDLLNEISNSNPVPRSHVWNRELYVKVRNYNKDWTVFPSGFFNSEWQDDPEQNWGSDEKNAFNEIYYKLYDGAFSWHWHNRWDNKIHPKSKWKKIENIIEKKLKDKLNIDYKYYNE